MDWQISDELEAAHLRMKHGLNLLDVLWFAFDGLNRDKAVENDKIASAIYIAWEQFNNVTDAITNCINQLQVKQKQIHEE